ncbi:helix-turn-helix transcriptional regulator [Paraclostridium tenue]|uniref:HTH araC/xylS-type domain-containing protein n=1 Tax=Paraclostridium tenue TaxID=1737 RepID=A0ABP3X8E8_9FIRM
MFDKTTSPKFKQFGDIVNKEMTLKSKNILYEFKNKKIDSLKLTDSNDIYINVVNGIAMILLSIDCKNIISFIINRPIRLKKDVCFNLISVSDNASVYISYSSKYLNCISLNEDYKYSSISSSLNIKEIYTKFYQEKGLNYNFSGESHPYWELTYVDKGKLYTNINNTSYSLEQGDLIFYAPFQFHTQYTLNNNSSSYLTINFNMDFKNYELLCNKVFKLNRNSYHIIKLLISELSNDDIYSNDLSLCYLKQLIINILRLGSSYKNFKPTTNMQQSYEDNLLNEILNFINININNKIYIETICDKFCISSTMLHSLFKKNMNVTVKSYINNLKLNKSKELIKHSSFTLSEISDVLSFSSIHYFSRKFKSHFGISPTEYAKSIYK